MTHVKFRPIVPAFNALQNFDKILNDVFNTPVYHDGTTHATTPSVNVIENAAEFRIELAAPGLAKEDFKIHIEDSVLTVTGEKKAETETKEGETKNDKVVRREFSYAKIKRSFNLPETVDVTAVKAAYEAGVLVLSLPKIEVKKTAQTVEIQ